MSTSPTQDLDRHIQFSLVSKVRHAANEYHFAPETISPAALETYLFALEALADYVAAKWRGDRAVLEFPVARKRMKAASRLPARQESPARIIPFVPPTGGNASPLTAA